MVLSEDRDCCCQGGSSELACHTSHSVGNCLVAGNPRDQDSQSLNTKKSQRDTWQEEDLPLGAHTSSRLQGPISNWVTSTTFIFRVLGGGKSKIMVLADLVSGVGGGGGSGGCLLAVF